MRLPGLTPEWIEFAAGAASKNKPRVPALRSFLRLTGELAAQVRIEEDGDALLSMVEWRGKNRRWIATFREGRWFLERKSTSGGSSTVPGPPASQ